jgi:UDP-N-acetylglucosamine 2-epimerase (non-hydrolysing)
MGTRPEVIKLSPVIGRLRMAGWCRLVQLNSGQQGALLQRTLAEFGLEHEHVAPGAAQHPVVLVEMLAARLRPAMARARPDIVLVHGDTATALAGTQAAVELGIPVGHVEAGLRTYNLEHPFPEEGHRQAIARLASLHFAPTTAAMENLIREGVDPSSVLLTGNTVVDAMNGEDAAPSARERAANPVALVTLHRRELAPFVNSVIDGLAKALDDHPELAVILPAHPNPTISAPLRAAFGSHPQVDIVQPLPHAQFLAQLAKASLVMTDSGGVQEEAATLGIPLVVAREVTERPEILTNGRAIVAGFDAETLRRAIGWALKLPRAAGRHATFGDGRASDRIEMRLKAFFETQESWPKLLASAE